MAKSQIGLQNAQSAQAMSQVGLNKSSMLSKDADTSLTSVQTLLAGQNYEVLVGTKNALISAASSDAQAKALGLPGMSNLSDVQQSRFGKVLAYINAALSPVATGAGVAARFTK